jgi:hypothetical protein
MFPGEENASGFDMMMIGLDVVASNHIGAGTPKLGDLELKLVRDQMPSSSRNAIHSPLAYSTPKLRAAHRRLKADRRAAV